MSAACPVRAVTVVARRSWKVPDAEVARLPARNDSLFGYFRQSIYPAISGFAFSSSRPDFEFTNIVLNKMSSNTNIADDRSHGISLLRRRLATYEAAPGENGKNAVGVILSGDDGFFTNINGVLGFFSRYVNYPIRVIICTGENTFDHYKMESILKAITDIKEHRVDTTKEQALVRGWIGIAVNKELIAQANYECRTRSTRALLRRTP